MAGTTKLMTPGGGGVLLTPASSIASDVTVNVPSQNCTLGIQGPAFSAYQSSVQSVTNNVWTKIMFQTEEFDTANCFDNATNYRFTPNVAGYYQITGTVFPQSTVFISTSIYKNGTAFKQGNQVPSAAGLQATSLIYFNGSTDYVEFYMYCTVNTNISAANNLTYFQGVLVRAA